MRKVSPSPSSLLPLPCPEHREVPLPQHPQGSRGDISSIQEHPLHCLAWGTHGMCSPEASLPIYPITLCPNPHWLWCSLPMPRLKVPGTPLGTPNCMPALCPLSCHPGYQHLHLTAARCQLSVVRSWHPGAVSAELVCVEWHYAVLLATSFSPTAAANPSPQKVGSDSVSAEGYKEQAVPNGLCCTS